MIEFLVFAFFAGFFFFPVFARLIYPRLLDLILEVAEKERDRVNGKTDN